MEVETVSEKKGLLGSISYVMIIMLLSRVLSLVSSSVYMSFFGADDLYLNIYSYAITIPNTIFNCFGTALSTVVIPIYASHIAEKKYDKAQAFANNIITVASVFTACLVLIGIALSFVIPRFTAFNEGESYNFAVKSLMIMMPVMIFYGLNYIFQGMLQSVGKYGWPAFVSVPSSLIVILYVFTLADKFGVTGLLVATFIGLSLQALILIPPLFKSGYRYTPSFNLKNPDIISAGKMTVPVLIGVSAYQLNMFYNTSMIARFEGMVSLLTYVQNIVVYMVLAFVYSVTAVLYPKLTQSIALGKTDEYKNTLSTVLTNVWMLLVPITFGLISVRDELLSLIIGWGKTGEESLEAASLLMLMYCIGIIGVGSKEILDRAFYAIKDTKTPAVNGFIIMAVNIILSLILIKHIGAYGIPLAYSVASITGLCVLLYLLKRKIGAFAKGLGTSLVKSVISGAVMYVAVVAVRNALSSAVVSDGVAARLVKLGVPCIVGVVVYGVMLLILMRDKLKALRNR